MLQICKKKPDKYTPNKETGKKKYIEDMKRQWFSAHGGWVDNISLMRKSVGKRRRKRKFCEVNSSQTKNTES